MKKASDRILKRSVLSILVAAALYTPQAMAGFTKVVTEGSTVTDETVENGRQTVASGGTADKTTIDYGGEQIVYGTADKTTINNGGTQYVQADGTATGTTIKNGGLMQNAGEDTGTTVKDGGVYELGRYSYSSPDTPDYRYYGSSSASDLTVEAGGRAEVYAGTLTGATVSGKDATLTLMTPQGDKESIISTLKGKVSVTDHASLVSQRGADMSEADLSLSSQGTLILKGDAGCPEEGCSWTVN
ncbi:TPA: AIDA repeat-containing protein, partial [Escherichia coli]